LIIIVLFSATSYYSKIHSVNLFFYKFSYLQLSVTQWLFMVSVYSLTISLSLNV